MPNAWGAEPQVKDLRRALVSDVRLRSWLLLVVNVANLMIGQTTAPAHEMALRTSLGATPARLARQLLTEAMVLANVGGLFGVLLGYAQVEGLRHLFPAKTARPSEVPMDGRARRSRRRFPSPVDY
jgi:hypothetical protein